MACRARTFPLLSCNSTSWCPGPRGPLVSTTTQTSPLAVSTTGVPVMPEGLMSPQGSEPPETAVARWSCRARGTREPVEGVEAVVLRGDHQAPRSDDGFGVDRTVERRRGPLLVQHAGTWRPPDVLAGVHRVPAVDGPVGGLRRTRVGAEVAGAPARRWHVHDHQRGGSGTAFAADGQSGGTQGDGGPKRTDREPKGDARFAHGPILLPPRRAVALWRTMVPRMGGYDALLLVSFGGPERAEDVMPFLRRVTAGRGVPQGRLEEVAEHYYAAGGASPINAQCRALLEALRDELAGLPLALYWGNRNWHPLLEATLAQMRDDGMHRASRS